MEVSLSDKNVRYVEGEIILSFNGKDIKLCHSIINIIKRYVQSDPLDLEAGGVLIARESIDNNALIIEYATEPMENDIRKKHRFYRRDQGHIDSYNELYVQRKSIYVYVGEWHTHPEKLPHYSMMDKCNRKKIAKLSPERDYYHMIVGTSHICIRNEEIAETEFLLAPVLMLGYCKRKRCRR